MGRALPEGLFPPPRRNPESPPLQIDPADEEPTPATVTMPPPPHAPLARYVWRALHALRPLLRGRLTAQRVETIADCVDDTCLVVQRVVAELNRWGDEMGWFFDVRSLRRRLLQAARGEVVIR